MTKVWEFPNGEAWAADTAAEAAAELRERNEEDGSVYDGRKAKGTAIGDWTDFEKEFGTRKHRARDAESRSADWYETFKGDLEKVLTINKHNPKIVWTVVWTVVEGDSGLLYLVAGYHIVNRLQYVISKRPWKTGQEEFLW